MPNPSSPPSMPSDEPKPCPFCGAEVERIDRWVRHTTGGNECPLTAKTFLAESWNTRAASLSVPPGEDVTRMFPIQNGPDIPWSAIAPFEKYAMQNHGGQSLERLAQRGGLGVDEAIYVLRCERHNGSVGALSMLTQIKTLLELAAHSSSSPSSDTEK